MKLLSKISLLICFMLLINTAFAENGEEKKSEPKNKISQQEGEKKQTNKEIDLLENPEGADPLVEEPVQEQTTVVDSTEDTSVSKYNFIFYFLYKMKYNEVQEDMMF